MTGKRTFPADDTSFNVEAIVMGFMGVDGKFVPVSAANPLPNAADGGTSAVTLADGANVAQGALADAAVAAGASGSVNAHLRSISRDVVAPTPLYPASTSVSSAAYESSHVLSAAPAKLHSLTGYNAGVGQFYQLHDAAALPAEAAVPKITFYVPAASSFSLDYGLRGRSFATGIVICNSSTGPTKTIGAADSWFDAQVV